MPIAMLSSAFPPACERTKVSTTAPKPSASFHLWGEDGLSFADIVDIVNPLQHIPVVSTIYRAFTGDDLAPAARVLGDFLFGGPIGAAVGAANSLIEYASGKDAGEHLLALLHVPSRLADNPSSLATETTAAAVPLNAPSALGALPQECSCLSHEPHLTNLARLMVAHHAYRGHQLMTSPVKDEQSMRGCQDDKP